MNRKGKIMSTETLIETAIESLGAELVKLLREAAAKNDVDAIGHLTSEIATPEAMRLRDELLQLVLYNKARAELP